MPVLEEFCEPFSGYFLYYPRRWHASPVLRALIDHLRDARRSALRPKARAERSPGGADAILPRRSGSKSRN